MVYLGLVLLRYVPCGGVDTLMVMLSRLVYGDLSKYGIHKPREGPFFMKAAYGKYPVIDAGTCEKIKSGQIQVINFYVIRYLLFEWARRPSSLSLYIHTGKYNIPTLTKILKYI